MSAALNAKALEACPFCSGEASLHDGGPGCFFVQCDMCNATSDDGTQDRAIARWNSRAALSSLPQAGVSEPRVKQLVWRNQECLDEDGGFDVAGSWADAGLVHYWTDLDYAQEDPIRLYRGDRLVGWFPSEEKAQAAAQSDFETRILPFLEAALSSQQEEAVPVAPRDAVHLPGCSHSRAPMWLCTCPRPALAPATSQAKGSE